MPDNPTSTLVHRLKNWCTRHRIKQVELSSMLDVTPAAVTEWFKGRSHPSGKLIVQIMEMVKHKPPAGELRQKKGKPEKRTKPKKETTEEPNADSVAEGMTFE